MISLAVLDLETTGVDPETDRIVSAAVGVLDVHGEPVNRLSRAWLVDPGVEIPPGATAVHGISTAQAIQGGTPAKFAIAQIAEHLATLLAAGYPLAVFNGRFDLTMLDREVRRHEVSPLVGDISEGDGWGIWFEVAPVLDGLVLDKARDQFRRGSRRLVDVAQHYGVPLGSDAHGAQADAVAAGRVVQAILEKRDRLRGLLDTRDLDRYPTEAAALHAWSVIWAREQAESLADYFERTNNPAAATVRSEWPIIPTPSASDTY